MQSATPTDTADFWKHPDYAAEFNERADRLRWLRTPEGQRELPHLRDHYREHIADFINDWGVTIDPRNARTTTPVVMTFRLFQRQRELLDWFNAKWVAGEPGILEKSRDVGASWLAMAWAASVCLFRRNIAIGFGSAKEDKVDLLGDPGCLFYKGRQFLSHLPPEFSYGWDVANKAHTSHMRILVPMTGSSIVGESGDNIGRGGRTSVYFIDEAAHIERPKLIDASLSANTDVRIDMSSVNGMGNSFAEKRHGGNVDVFIFDWRDDPRKDDAWYQKKCDQIADPVIVAQEIDRNYAASVEGVVIPSAWVNAAIGLAEKLKLDVTGEESAALDVADEGRDLNAFGVRHGVALKHAETWSGKDSDIMKTTLRAFMLCDQRNLEGFCYDADGLGAGVRGDARTINEAREKEKIRKLRIEQFRGSAAVLDPEREIIEGRKNKDFFQNYKAQSWWALRFRFQEAFRAASGQPYDPDKLISLDAGIKELSRLKSELSQPTWTVNLAGKIVIEKAPDDTMSPNLGDMVMMLFAPKRPALKINAALLQGRPGMSGPEGSTGGFNPAG